MIPPIKPRNVNCMTDAGPGMLSRLLQRRRADKDEIVESTSMRRQELRRERREVGGRNGVQERGEYGGGMR
ncbi:hypothetical protein RRG08_040156 [Elysia crispata]|uniref:Uncharacterized protein n=1 Tax=Elysia crispata TaxID=231223 RepID=A0AAE1CN45_9GAST|nr:hypothetical protein RRG08_040156 [Elysia crispata]